MVRDVYRGFLRIKEDIKEDIIKYGELLLIGGYYVSMWINDIYQKWKLKRTASNLTYPYETPIGTAKDREEYVSLMKTLLLGFGD